MALIVFLYGITIGSFLNVLVYRIPRKEEFVKTRSHCTKCFKSLNFLDLIPVFSFIFLKGRCRYCKAKVSFRYIAFELLNGIFYVLIYILYSLNSYSILLMILSSVLLVIAQIDFSHYYVPNVLNIFLLFTVILYLVFFRTRTISEILVTNLLLISPFLLANILAKTFKIRALGMGDMKLLFILGFVISKNSVYNFFLLTIVLLFVKMVVLRYMRKLNKKSVISFADIISFAFIINIFISPLID